MNVGAGSNCLVLSGMHQRSGLRIRQFTGQVPVLERNLDLASSIPCILRASRPNGGNHAATDRIHLESTIPADPVRAYSLLQPRFAPAIVPPLRRRRDVYSIPRSEAPMLTAESPLRPLRMSAPARPLCLQLAPEEVARRDASSGVLFSILNED